MAPGTVSVDDACATLEVLDPTRVIIGQVSLSANPVEDYLATLGYWGMSVTESLDLLAAWDPDLAAYYTNASSDTIEAALLAYLDPDEDGQVVVLSWETVSELGTIGFYVERRGNEGRWQFVVSGMLPGMINAPMGAHYLLADPSAVEPGIYHYRLIEQEAWGTTRTYGPFMLELQ